MPTLYVVTYRFLIRCIMFHIFSFMFLYPLLLEIKHIEARTSAYCIHREVSSMQLALRECSWRWISLRKNMKVILAEFSPINDWKGSMHPKRTERSWTQTLSHIIAVLIVVWSSAPVHWSKSKEGCNARCNARWWCGNTTLTDKGNTNTQQQSNPLGLGAVAHLVTITWDSCISYQGAWE